ncbi:MAG: cytochrome [Caulobacteraceae bacterium]|nr:cytochrome [Caulobacteraceae bacterium]
MTKRIVEIALCAVLFVGVASAGLAQGQDSVAKRTAAMKAMGAAAGATNAAAGTGDFATASAKAKELSATVKSLGGLFLAGSGPDAVKTRAKPEVWSDAAGFKAAIDKAAADADAVVTAADSKNADGVKAAVTAFQANCGACHTKYRGPALPAA